MRLTPHAFRLLCAALTFLACAVGRSQTISPPDMTFHCTPNPVYVGSSATCRSHVGGGATGSVTFSVGTATLATIPLDSNGDAVGTTSGFSPQPGVYTLRGTYSGDAQYNSTYREEGLTVYSGKALVTAETLTCSPYLLYTGQPATCTIHVPGGATGTASFKTDGNAWGTATLDGSGTAILGQGLVGAPTGPHTVEATYSGDANFNGFVTTTSATVYALKPQPISMKVGCTPASVTAGQSGSCQVQVTGGATGTVDLYVHDTYLQTATLDASGTAMVAASSGSLSVGSYSVLAAYSGDTNFDIATAATSINIVSSTSRPAVTLACSPYALTPGQGTNCTAQASPGATGNVLFYVAGQYWKTATLDGSSRAVAANGLSTLPSGSYSVTAYYAGDGNFSTASGGTTVAIAVAKALPPVTLACTPSALVSGSSTTCTAAVGGGATGAVYFTIFGTIAEGLGLDDSGKVVFQNQLQGAANQTYNIQALYQGDPNFAAASASSTVTVSAAKSTPTITAALSPTTIRNTGHISVAAHVGSGATGSVDITANGGFVARLPLNAAGDISGSERVPASNGTYTIGFNYLGDANFNPVSQSVMLTIDPNAPDPPPTTPGQPPNHPPAAGDVLYSYSITQPDGTTSGFAPNGNILAYSDTVNGQWAASYDALNRITGAVQAKINGSPQVLPPGNGSQQVFCWTYDSFGNRTLQVSSDQAFGPNCQAAASASLNMVAATYNANNQITSISGAPGGYMLDAAGNTLDDGPNQYLYDGDGRMCASLKKVVGLMTGYLYDAEGQRVAKGTLSSFSCDLATNGFQMSNEYVAGPDGQPLTEFDGQGNWLHTNAYAGGQLVATYDTKGVHFHLSDWLGTRRVQTDSAGNPELTCSGGSFGDQLACAGPGTDATEQHFTGKERDTESGLDYFGARYYGSNMGRFTSPDPGNASAFDHLGDPQAWNGYAYGRNNPLLYTDPDGESYHICDQNGQNCSDVSDKQFDQIQHDARAAGESFKGGNITFGDGSAGGSYKQTDVDLPGDPAANQAGANMIGNGGMGMVNAFMKSMVYNAIGEGIGQGIGIGVEAYQAGRAARSIAGLREGGQVVKQMATGGRKGAEIIQKAGGETQAASEYGAVKGAETIRGDVRYKTLDDGSVVTLRGSSGGQPTVSIQHADGGVTKIRY